MIINISNLLSTLVKVKSGLTGSGVWINIDHSDCSYVFTAKHNITSKQVEVYDCNGKELDVERVTPLDNIDVSVIKVKGRCSSNIELCLNEKAETKENSICWILGHPKALLKISKDEVMEHQGAIILSGEDISFKISDTLPQYKDRDHIDGFSGGPIFEIENSNIYLKGIITDTFDEDFSYQKIKGIKTNTIYKNLPINIRDEVLRQEDFIGLVNESCEYLEQYIQEYILDIGFLDSLESLDIDYLQRCEYFYLSDDKPRETQHLSLLRNKDSIMSYVHSRVLAKIMNDNLSLYNENPINYSKSKIFTIHVTDFTEEEELAAKLIKQSNSQDYADSILLIIYSNEDNNLRYIKKRRIEKMIANYTKEPLLYDKSSEISEKKIIRDFLESHIENGVKFSIMNIRFLIDMIITRVKNEMRNDEYDRDVIKSEIMSEVEHYE
ncbi:hypothetical protein GA076_18885 [Vibrio parahaemolyticus]|nr:hypothetical protein [Vibrio parahaemolyticus]